MITFNVRSCEEMSCIKDLLEKMRLEIEGQLKERLNSLSGVFLRAYLPQTWIIETEEEVVTFHVDQDGNASVNPKRAGIPDVTIRSEHAVVSTALKTRDQSKVPQGKLKVISHTSKGRVTFSFLRGRLGF